MAQKKEAPKKESTKKEYVVVQGFTLSAGIFKNIKLGHYKEGDRLLLDASIPSEKHIIDFHCEAPKGE